jgi:aspartyl-tRNA(Asn)/glutamyl-tRNA(Gln) amidotransferase subunit A
VARVTTPGRVGDRPNDVDVSLRDLRRRLDAGETTSSELVKGALLRIADPAGEGRRTFTDVFRMSALAAAEASDTLRTAGIVRSALDGIPISVKDLFDVAGSVTRAGSTILADRPPAARDAEIVGRLRRAGAVIVGKTNMTEFAYSGIGMNPHFDTPRNPWDRATGRIPGGSSSGAAVSVADGMAAAAIGTDTGGSVRIPAALCGLTGFKPTARRIPLTGCYPLSPSLDSIGPLAASVADCALLDAVMAGEEPAPLAAVPLSSLRFLAPTNYVRADCDAVVSAAFADAVDTLRAAGAVVDEAPLEPLDRVFRLQSNGGLPAAEVYWAQRTLLEAHAGEYDPNVYFRIMRGSTLSAADYLDLLTGRADLIARFAAATRGYDALLWPTVPVVAPALAELEDRDVFGRFNALILRNPSVVNTIDGCALSIPAYAPGTPPVGLGVVGRSGEDRTLLEIGSAVEAALIDHLPRKASR